MCLFIHVNSPHIFRSLSLTNMIDRCVFVRKVEWARSQTLTTLYRDPVLYTIFESFSVCQLREYIHFIFILLFYLLIYVSEKAILTIVNMRIGGGTTHSAHNRTKLTHNNLIICTTSVCVCVFKLFKHTYIKSMWKIHARWGYNLYNIYALDKLVTIQQQQQKILVR